MVIAEVKKRAGNWEHCRILNQYNAYVSVKDCKLHEMQSINAKLTLLGDWKVGNKKVAAHCIAFIKVSLSFPKFSKRDFWEVKKSANRVMVQYCPLHFRHNLESAFVAWFRICHLHRFLLRQGFLPYQVPNKIHEAFRQCGTYRRLYYTDNADIRRG